MPIPRDYVIDTLEKKIESMHTDMKENFALVRSEFYEFKKQCYDSMQCHDIRLKENEKFRWQVVAIASATVASIGFVIWIIERFTKV